MDLIRDGVTVGRSRRGRVPPVTLQGRRSPCVLFYPGPPGADNRVMQPRFGIVTRVIAAVFALAGVGAAMAVLGVGDASDKLALLLLAAGFLVLAMGMWAESIWAWWAGAAAVILTILLSRVLNVPGGAGLVWLATVIGFIVSGFQGWRDKAKIPPRPAR